MATLTRNEALEVLGEVDELTLARIIDTGVTQAELRAAMSAVVRRERQGLETPSTQTVLQRLLSDLLAVEEAEAAESAERR